MDQSNTENIGVLIVPSVGFIASSSVWFVLNYFRRKYYDSAVEGPSMSTSPYWTIVHLQDWLQWLIGFSLLLTVLLLLFRLAQLIAGRIAPD